MNPAISRASVALSLTLLFLVYAAAGGASSAQIVGRWRSLETSKGGIGAMYEFHPNGDLDFSPGAVVDMPWRIEKDQLILPPATVNAPEQKQTIKWLGENKLQFVSSDSAGAELTRIGDRSDPANPIVGEWTGTREMGDRKLEMHWFFYPAGKGLFLLAFLTQHGHYTITDSTLHMEMPNARAADFKFQVKGDILTLFKPERADESRFARY